MLHPAPPPPALPPARTRAAGPRQRAHRDRRGVVLILMLFAMLLLAAMVFYVINLGRHAKARIASQNAADAAALAGAGWVARTLNTVAMNNVEQTRAIATINALDAAPLAVEVTLAEERFFLEQVERRLEEMQGRTLRLPHANLQLETERQLRLLRAELQDEVEMLEPLDRYFAASDVREVTHWITPTSNRGRLWRAMLALTDLSEAALESLPVAAQVNAVQTGTINLLSDQAEQPVAFMVPFEPRVPYVSRNVPDRTGRYARFDDFERPVRWGLLPAWADHEIISRGPFDTVFGMRRELDRIADPNVRVSIRGGGDPSSQVTGSSGPFGGPSSQGNVDGGSTSGMIPTRYQTFGPQRSVNEIVTRLARHDLRPSLQRSRFARFHSELAATKLNYLWPQDLARMAYGSTTESNPGPNPDKALPLPQWGADYPTEVTQPIEDFCETAVFVLGIKSAYPRSDPRFMTTCWAFEPEARPGQENIISAFNLRGRGVHASGSTARWWLPRRQNDEYHLDPVEAYRDTHPRVTITEVGHHAWMVEFDYQLSFDNEICLPPLLDADGQMVEQTAYYYQVILYAGRNMHAVEPTVIDPEEVRRQRSDNPQVADDLDDPQRTAAVVNPYQGFDRHSKLAPAPVDLDHSLLNKSLPEAALRQQVRQFTRDRLSFLAVARRESKAALWAAGFDSRNPQAFQTALAASEVFNTHSFDLWTQMWQARLKPVEDYDRYVVLMAQGPAAADLAGYLHPGDVQEAAEYLHSLSELAPYALTH